MSSDLEKLIKMQGAEIKDEIPKEPVDDDVYTAKGMQRAEDNIRFYDFMKKLGLIVESECKSYKVALHPKSDVYKIIKDPDAPLNNPIITFNVKKRELPKNQSYKPTLKEYIKGGAEIHSMRFDYEVEFDFFSNTYEGAYELMEKFEYIMYAYSSYLKGQGIVEYHFLRQVESEDFNVFREKINVLSLIYYVQEERQMVIAREEVKNNITKIAISVEGEKHPFFCTDLDANEKGGNI